MSAGLIQYVAENARQEALDLEATTRALEAKVTANWSRIAVLLALAEIAEPAAKPSQLEASPAVGD